MDYIYSNNYYSLSGVKFLGLQNTATQPSKFGRKVSSFFSIYSLNVPAKFDLQLQNHITWIGNLNLIFGKSKIFGFHGLTIGYIHANNKDKSEMHPTRFELHIPWNGQTHGWGVYYNPLTP